MTCASSVDPLEAEFMGPGLPRREGPDTVMRGSCDLRHADHRARLSRGQRSPGLRRAGAGTEGTPRTLPGVKTPLRAPRTPLTRSVLASVAALAVLGTVAACGGSDGPTPV